MFDHEQGVAHVVSTSRAPRRAEPGTLPGGSAGALLRLQALAGNRAVASALSTVVQRCAPENPGCDCADDSANEKQAVPSKTLSVSRAAGTPGVAVQRMASCPPALPESAPVPPGWKPYFGDSSAFHCGYRGILEDRRPTPDDPQNECFYDHGGALVDENHPHAGCRGTPNQYDSSSSTAGHIFLDSGGILRSGWGAFWASRKHDLVEGIMTPARCAQACKGIPDPRCMGTCMSQRR